MLHDQVIPAFKMRRGTPWTHKRLYIIIRQLESGDTVIVTVTIVFCKLVCASSTPCSLQPLSPPPMDIYDDQVANSMHESGDVPTRNALVSDDNGMATHSLELV